MKQDREQFLANLKIQALQIAAKLIKDYKLESSLIPLARKILKFLLEDIDPKYLSEEVEETKPQIEEQYEQES